MANEAVEEISTQQRIILLFAEARDRVGRDRVVLTIPDAQIPTVGQVRRLLIEQFPSLRDLGPRLLAAVDSRYAMNEDPVPANVDVAFFPPVSGG